MEKPTLSRDQAILYGGMSLGAFAEREGLDGKDVKKTIKITDSGTEVSLFCSFGDRKTGIKVGYFVNLKGEDEQSVTQPLGPS
jgi:hypothetical protein